MDLWLLWMTYMFLLLVPRGLALAVVPIGAPRFGGNDT